MFYFSRERDSHTSRRNPVRSREFCRRPLPKGLPQACCTMTRHLLQHIALPAAGTTACDDMCYKKKREPTCSGLSQRVKDRWRDWYVVNIYQEPICENDVCCASDEDDCCEANVGAIVGLVIALVVVVGGSIYAYRKYKGGKTKEPDEEARHGGSSEPDVAPQREEPETEPEAEAEELGLMGKLAWYLFGEEEPAVASEGVAVEAEPIADFKGFMQEELEPER